MIFWRRVFFYNNFFKCFFELWGSLFRVILGGENVKVLICEVCLKMDGIFCFVDEKKF